MHRANNYGHAEDSGKRPVRNKVVQWSQDGNVYPALTATTPPSVGVLEVNEKSLPELTILWYVVQLMKAKPSLFPRSNIATDPDRKPCFPHCHFSNCWLINFSTDSLLEVAQSEHTLVTLGVALVQSSSAAPAPAGGLSKRTVDNLPRVTSS